MCIRDRFQNVPIPSAGMTTAAILIVVAGPDLPDPPDRVAALGQEAVLDLSLIHI